MLEPALILLASTAMLLINKLGQKTGIPTKYIVLSSTFIVGMLYALFTAMTPPDIQESVRSFIATAFAVQWALYEFILKKQ